MESASTPPAARTGADQDAGALQGRAGASEAELASRLRLSVTRLHRRLRQHSAGSLTQSQASALASIGQLGSPTLGALASRESVQPPSMTRIVGALEALGHVSRVVDPADRRVTRVTLTTQGIQVLDRSRSLKNAFLARQLHRLAPGERQAVADLTILLERLVAMDES